MEIVEAAMGVVGAIVAFLGIALKPQTLDGPDVVGRRYFFAFTAVGCGLILVAALMAASTSSPAGPAL